MASNPNEATESKPTGDLAVRIDHNGKSWDVWTRNKPHPIGGYWALEAEGISSALILLRTAGWKRDAQRSNC